MEDKIKRAELNLDRKLDWTGKYDTRIAFVSAISIAMLGVLANSASKVTTWNQCLYISFGLAAILLFVSLILVYVSQYPKTGSPNSSLIFFGTIAKMKFDEYRKKFNDSNEQEYLDDLLYQIHINSNILDRKFSLLKKSLVFIGLAIIPWLISIYLSKIYLT